MTRLLLLAALLAGLPAQAASPLEAALDQVKPEAGADKDVALIVAIEDYDKAPDIPGARANARLWRQWFRARGTRDVRVIEDGDATHGWDRYGKPQGLLLKVDAAAAQARRKGGTLWFVFIGHGAPVNERGVNQGVLLAHGVQQTAQSLRTHGIVVDGDLMPRLAKAGKSVAVLDACFSGQSREGALVPGLQPLIPAAFSVSKAVTVFTAAKGTEFAGPLPDANRPAFSYLMLGALAGWADGEVDRKRDRRVTSEEAFEWVKLQMARVIHGRRQTPTMRGPRRALSRAWAGFAAQRSPTPATPTPPPPVTPAPSRRYAVGAQVAPATAQRPALRYIPAGTFIMGSPPDDQDRDDNEQQRTVTLTRAFAMMQTEVTQAQWQAVMGSQPAYFGGRPDAPVERVSWYDAVAYANALSKAEGRSACYALGACRGTPGGGCASDQMEGMACGGDYQCTVRRRQTCTGYRLPTEAEWEYAARASSAAQRDSLDSVAWHGGNSSRKTQLVGRKAANHWGLHDMQGNVSEWTCDWYTKAPDGARDPVGPPSGKRRATRGGSWFVSARWVRLAYRSGTYPVGRQFFLGFRLVRTQLDGRL